ncbi:MAG: YaiI/YqxD family protein [Hyphomicrobiales bacterium]|nr:YaiI/YqxD family protein [Hyphomicrobiales bacterium]
MSEGSKPITIYVDADACPVKAEIYRVAERYGIKVYIISNSPIAVPRTPMIERVVVSEDPDAADHWIAEKVSRGDIVITADIPLAHRCLQVEADVISPTGRPLNEASIGMTLATRNLMQDLRSAGHTTSGPRPFLPRDRSNFLSALDAAIVRLKRAGFGAASTPSA